MRRAVPGERAGAVAPRAPAGLAEMAAVRRDGGLRLGGREVRGDDEGEPERAGDARTIDRRAEDPGGRGGALARDGAHMPLRDGGQGGGAALACALARRRQERPGNRPQHVVGDGAEVGQGLQNLVGEAGGIGPAPPQSRRGQRIGARRAPQPQPHAAGMERGERADLLGNDQRSVIGQHDAAAGDPDASGGGEHLSHENGRGRGEVGHGAVVLREPVAGIAGLVGGAGQLQHLAQGIGAGAPGRDRHEIEDGQHGSCGVHGLTLRRVPQRESG